MAKKLSKALTQAYGKGVLFGWYTLDEREVTDDCKLVPKKYIEAVTQWVIEYEEALGKTE